MKKFVFFICMEGRFFWLSPDDVTIDVDIRSKLQLLHHLGRWNLLLLNYWWCRRGTETVVSAPLHIYYLINLPRCSTFGWPGAR